MPLKLYEKEKILDACFEVFVENGYGSTTTAMLAKAAGISKALIFHHFNSKKALYLSILSNCFKKMAPVVNDEDMQQYSDYFEARGNSGFVRIEYLRDNPKVAKILLEAFYNTPDELKDDIVQFRAHMMSKKATDEDKRGKRLHELFNEIPLRDGVDRKTANEFVEIIMNHFNHKYLSSIASEEAMMDEKFWQEFKQKKNSFLEIIRYGIEDTRK